MSLEKNTSPEFVSTRLKKTLQEKQMSFKDFTELFPICSPGTLKSFYYLNYNGSKKLRQDILAACAELKFTQVAK